MTWIRRPQEVEELARSLAGGSACGLDTESDSFHHYFEKVCLVQIADASGRVFLVDPLALGPDGLAPLGKVTADPRVEKVLHGGENDIALLKRDFGMGFASLWDTQIAARMCGVGAFSLQALLENELGVRQPKGKKLQRCDWSRRPLAPEEEAYAAADVRHLLALRDRLREKLQTLGRLSWAAEECEALARLPPASRREPADFRRMPGARGLSPECLAVLGGLFRMREEWARQTDRPLFKVLTDEALLELARRRPMTAPELAKIRGLPRHLPPGRIRDLLAVLRGPAPAAPPASPPARPPRVQISAEAVRRIQRLRAWRHRASQATGIEPGLLLPQRLMRRIAIHSPPPRNLAELAGIEGIRRWRVEAFGAEILRACAAEGPA